MRLTVYQYFNKTASECLADSNGINLEELGKSYSSVAKDKRLSLVNWIWQTINRMNLFTNISSSYLSDTLSQLENIYSPVVVSSNRVLNSYLEGILNQIALYSPIESNFLWKSI